MARCDARDRIGAFGRSGRNLKAFLAAVVLMGAAGCTFDVHQQQVLTTPAPKAPVFAMAVALLLLLVTGAAGIFACADWLGTRWDLLLDRRPNPVRGFNAGVASAAVAVLATVLWMVAVSLIAVGHVARSANNDLPRTPKSLVQVTLKTEVGCSTDIFNDVYCNPPASDSAQKAADKLNDAAALIGVLALVCTILCPWMRAGDDRSFTIAMITMLVLMPIGLCVGLYLTYHGYPRFDAHVIGLGALAVLFIGLTLVCMAVTVAASMDALAVRPATHHPISA